MSSEKSLTPQIRFKGFTEAWEQRKLGDYGLVQMCRRIYKDQTSEIGDVPFFKIGTFGGQPDAFISRSLFQDYRKQYPFPSVGTPLISAAGSIGRTVIYQGEEAYFQDSNIVWLDNNEKLNNVFLNSLYKKIDWKLEGSTIKRLYNKDILNAEVCVPSTLEQCQVGSFFAHLDSLITLHQRKLDAIKKIKSALLEKMFPKDGSDIPEIRFTGFTEAWEQRKLGDFSKILGGFAWSSKEYTPKGKFLVITISNVTGDYFIDDSIGNRIDLEKESNYILGSGDILVSLTGNVGRVSKMGPSKGVLNQRVAKMIPSKKIEVEFLFQLMRDTKFELKMIESGQGAAQKNISNNNILLYSTNIPNISEQRRIGHTFKKIDSLITLHQRKLDALKKIKSALLEKMFV